MKNQFALTLKHSALRSVWQSQPGFPQVPDAAEMVTANLRPAGMDGTLLSHVPIVRYSTLCLVSMMVQDIIKKN